MTLRRGYDLTVLKRVQSLSNREMLARALVITGATIGVWLTVGFWPVAAWTISYFCISVIYGLVLRRLPDRVGPRDLALVIAFEAVATAHWPVLFVYLWNLGTPSFQVVAMLIVAAAMTNAMGTRSEDRLLRISDVIAVALHLGLMVLLLTRDQAGSGQPLLVGAVAVLLLVWMVIFVREVSGLRQRLAQAERDMLERQRIEAIGRLTGGVAHDFNNILTVIGGNLDLAAEVTDNSERDALLAEARRATERAALVTAQLLAYSRQSVLAPQDVEICTALDRVQAFLARLLPDMIALHFIKDDALPSLRLDPTRFESALINLVLNARDAIEESGRIDVTARLCPTIAPALQGFGPLTRTVSGPFVCITVRDTGTGIAPEILPKVAEPYFTTKPVGRGSGLGLSMAKGFAEQSGGALQILSTLGVGTEVHMYFPARTTERSAVL